jgi:hypothetical protein
MNAQLSRLVVALNREKKITPFRGTILALDPGETTGYAVFYGDGVAAYDWEIIDQVKTWPEIDAVRSLSLLLDQIKPNLVVAEQYRVYDWKSDDHKWSAVNTVQVIGCVWTLCVQRAIPLVWQSAQNAKGFWTDDRLKEYNLYQAGVRHGRDATRHALQYLCFGSKP